MPMVDSESREGYRPPPEFTEEGNEPLLDINLTQSTELWLFRLPFSDEFLSNIDGQELSLKLDNDGQLASFEDSSGTVYDFVSYVAHEPEETVFLPSAAEPKIAGKISRRVSIVHYPDPKEPEKLISANERRTHRNSSGATGTTSRYFPVQSGYTRSSKYGLAVSSKGSKKSSLSEVGEPSDNAKRSVSKSMMYENPSSQDISNRRHVPEHSHGHSTGVSSMSSDHSHGGKSKKRKQKE